MIQMLRGTDILLHSGDQTTTVGNVLIGEPSADGRSYTLGIPKGDQNIWTDRKLSFFGRTFRTIGLPVQGIEANIPLCWHKKVKAEYAEITGQCTVYEKGTYTRHVFTDVFFYDGRGEKTSKTGNLPTENAIVKIYSFAHDGSFMPKAGDIIVNGECPVIFDTATEQAASESMAELRRIAGDIIVIASVKAATNGLLPDIEITGR